MRLSVQDGGFRTVKVNNDRQLLELGHGAKLTKKEKSRDIAAQLANGRAGQTW